MKFKTIVKSQKFIDNMIWICWSFLYAFAFPTYNASVFIWFIFVPVFAFAYLRPIHLTVRYSFFYSMPFIILAYYWMYGFWEPALLLLTPLYALFFSFFFACVALIGKNLKKWRWLIVPMVWLSNELLRSIGYHGFMWNMLGDTQWSNTIMIQSADLFGVWGVSFLILLINSVLAELVARYLEKGRRVFTRDNVVKVSIAGGLLAVNLIYGVIQFYHYDQISRNSPKEKLALIQPNSPSRDPNWWRDHWENYGAIWKLNAEAAVHNPDMIIWSETMVKNYVWDYLKNYSPDEEVNLFNIRFVKMAKEFNMPILLTSPDLQNGKNYNTADLIDPKTNIRQENAKIHLVPFGEWMPIYSSIPILKEIMDIEGAGSYTPSTNFNIIQGRKSRFRVLVCYEDLFSILARKFIKRGVNYFINSTNAGWAYKLGFAHPMWQHLAGSTLTAVTVRRPIARATNTGVTGIIDLTGKFKGNIGNYAQGVYVGDVSIIDDKIESLFVKGGFVFPYILLLVALVSLIYVVLIKGRKGINID